MFKIDPGNATKSGYLTTFKGEKSIDVTRNAAQHAFIIAEKAIAFAQFDISHAQLDVCATCLESHNMMQPLIVTAQQSLESTCVCVCVCVCVL